MDPWRGERDTVSALLRFLGLDAPSPTSDDASLTRIAAELDGLSPDRARFFACFAYVLARVAGADLRIDEAEVQAMEDVLVQFAKIPHDEARLAVRIARSEVDRLGGTENYLVTQEFGRISSQKERLELIECLYAVAAADDIITGNESNDILSVAAEIGVPRQDVMAIRSRFRDHLAELRPIAGERR